ncbi:MAG TPA: LD-carboxypeptidase [Candidatus Obscuribacterales bacterium]
MVSHNPPVVKPPALKPGDRAALVCPASRPESPAVVNYCARLLEEMSLRPVVGKHVLRVHGYMAGTDEERLEDLLSFLQDDSIAAIFCVTGGFGSMRLLPHVDYGSVASQPKIVVGCDDNTALLLALNAMSGLVTFYGPNLDQVKTKHSFERLKTAVTDARPPSPVSAATEGDDDVLPAAPYAPVPGRVQGKLIGGNMSALVSLLGTPYQPDLQDAVLFLEDINERNDILERWLTTLYVSGELATVRGVAFGEFVNCGPKSSYNTLSLEDLLGERVKRLAIPSCFGLPLGQSSRMATVPIGVNVSFDAARGVLEFAEAGVS